MSSTIYDEARHARLLDLLRRIHTADPKTFAKINEEMHSLTLHTAMPIYDMACFIAIRSMVYPRWEEAERGRLLVAHAYVLERAAAAILHPEAVENIDKELRGLLLSRLNAKQKASAPSTGLRKAAPQSPNAVPRTHDGPIGDVTGMRQIYRNLGYEDEIDEFDTHPEKAMDYAPLREAWEARARELIDLGLLGSRKVNVVKFVNEFFPYFDAVAETEVSSINKVD